MKPLFLFLIGLGIGWLGGWVAGFFTILLYAKKMDKKEKEQLIKNTRDKWSKDKK